MRIGINGSSFIALGRPVADIVEHAAVAEADGFATYWVAQLGAPDALGVIGAMGAATSTIELGTAVISIWGRHPLTFAGQALTANELCDGRLALGIGLAHKAIEERMKIPFSRPAAAMQEYLSILGPLLRDRAVSVTGERWSADVDALGGRGDVPAPAVLLAAMGPRMLAIAGGETQGTILWLAGPTTIAERMRPALDAAATEAGRPSPRIVASVPICVTDDPEPVRQAIDAVLANYNELPSYRSVMDTDGVAGPGEASIVGDESHVRSELARFAEAGTTDFSALEFTTDESSAERTRALLKALATTGG